MRLAVVGCGSIGTRHLKNLRHLGYNDLVAVDPDSAARQRISGDLGINVLESLAALWEKAPDVVLVAGPTHHHVDIAREAARRDCHLFIEKPLSHSREGLTELLQAAAAGDLITMVGCNMRFHWGPQTVKHLLSARVIGAPLAARLQGGSYLPRWRPQQDYRQSYSASPVWGGAVLDWIHEIDLALWYLGPARVLAAALLPATAIGLSTDGLAEILLGHASGVLSSVHVNFIQRNTHRSCQIIGETGTLTWSLTDRKVLVYGEDGEITRELSEPRGYDLNQMYVEELRHFMECVSLHTPTLNPLAGGLAALEVALAAKQIAADTPVATPRT